MAAHELQQDLRRLAALHREQAEVFERVATNLAEALAALPQPRLMEPMPDTRPEFLTAPEFAALLRVDLRTLRQLRRSREVPEAMQVGRRPRWRRAEVESWLGRGGAR